MGIALPSIHEQRIPFLSCDVPILEVVMQ